MLRTAVAQWLRCCATIRKVAGSIPDGVNEIFHSHKIFPIALSKRNEYQEYFLGVKSGRCVRLTTLPPSWAIVTKSGNLNFLEHSGHLGPVMGLIYLYFTDATDRQTVSICSYSHLRKPVNFGYIAKRQAVSTVYILSPTRI